MKVFQDGLIKEMLYKLDLGQIQLGQNVSVYSRKIQARSNLPSHFQFSPKVMCILKVYVHFQGLF